MRRRRLAGLRQVTNYETLFLKIQRKYYSKWNVELEVLALRHYSNAHLFLGYNTTQLLKPGHKINPVDSGDQVEEKLEEIRG